MITDRVSREFVFVDDDGILWQGTRLCVPEDPTLREALMTEAHSSPFSIHPGNETLLPIFGSGSRVKRNFLKGPEMNEVTNEKVASPGKKFKKLQHQKSYADRHRRA
ncbi:hypothetical protein Tco_0286725 [Tanacetum coccineum]